ncbi:uncharacterized protein TNCV_2630921 [Trichonephila clavipes]|nr:uncharacterized protein TNCV_2630921 [Trichonephila clavipes]
MRESSSFVNPTPLAHADASRDVLPRGGTSQWRPTLGAIMMYHSLEVHPSKHQRELEVNWGAIAWTLRNTYIALIRPILEHGVQFYQVASTSNLDKIESVQFSSARIILGLRNNSSRDIVLYKADFQPLRLRSRYLLTKYFATLIGYSDQCRTFSYACSKYNNRHLKRRSPLSYAKSEEWMHNEVEYVSLARERMLLHRSMNGGSF